MKEKEKREIVQEALRTYRGLNVTYRDWLGPISSRAILPFRLYEEWGILWVQAYCWLAKDAVAFALPGILRAELRTQVVDKRVYVQIRDEHEMLYRPLLRSMTYIAGVNLQEV